MSEEFAQKYINERLKVQMDYYNKTAMKMRREYHVLSIITLVINALIPLLSLCFELREEIRYIVAALSTLSTILASILLLRNTKDSWIRYRNTHEMLARELTLYQHKCGAYRAGGDEYFIIRCEEIIQDEKSAWKDSFESKTNGNT